VSSATTYVVHKGDTLSGIAKRFGVSLSDLEAANPQIEDFDLIFPHQVINIPGPDSEDGSEGAQGDGEEEGRGQEDRKDHNDHKDKE
jgi:LysM repeat protein